MRVAIGGIVNDGRGKRELGPGKRLEGMTVGIGSLNIEKHAKPNALDEKICAIM